MRFAAVFEKKNALPGAQLHFAADNRHGFARAGEDHSNVCRHVVWPFVIVLVIGIFGHKLFKKPFDVTARRRSRVFHHGQAATGVLNKNRDRSVAHARLVDLISYLIGELVSAFAIRFDFEVVVLDVHTTRIASARIAVAR